MTGRESALCRHPMSELSTSFSLNVSRGTGEFWDMSIHMHSMPLLQYPQSLCIECALGLMTDTYIALRDTSRPSWDRPLRLLWHTACLAFRTQCPHLLAGRSCLQAQPCCPPSSSHPSSAEPADRHVRTKHILHSAPRNKGKRWQLHQAGCCLDSRSLNGHARACGICLMTQPDAHQGVIDGCITLLLGLHLLQPEELLALQLVQLPL